MSLSDVSRLRNFKSRAEELGFGTPTPAIGYLPWGRGTSNFQILPTLQEVMEASVPKSSLLKVAGGSHRQQSWQEMGAQSSSKVGLQQSPLQGKHDQDLT